MLQGMPKRLLGIFKDSSLFMALVKLNPYAVLWRSRPLTVNLVYNWRPSGAPVSSVACCHLHVLMMTMQFMEALILQGASALDLLSSSRAFPGGLSIAEARKSVVQNPPKPVPEVLNATFFDVLDAVYKKHLYTIREFFGLSKSSQRDRETWALAMDEYWREVSEEIEKWCTSRRSEIAGLRASTIDRAQVGVILDQMPMNLTWISKGLFNSTTFGMRLPTPAPLLCPVLLLDVNESIITLKPWLELVWRWLDPNVMCNSAVARFHGSSGSILASLERYKPVIETQELLCSIASEVFCMRTDALVALRNADTAGKTGPQPPSHSSLPMFGDLRAKDLLSTIVPALKLWRNNSPPEVIKSRALRYRDLHEDPKQNLEELPNGRVIIGALVITAYPWAACPINQLGGRLTAAANNALQALWIRNHQAQFYREIPAFWVLRHAIYGLLKDLTTGFIGFWDGLVYTSSAEPQMPPSSQGPDSLSTRGQLSGQSKANAIQAGTEKAIQAIAKILCSEEAGAIPVPVDEDKSEFQLFEEVHEAAMSLFEALAVASFRAQSVYNDPGHDRLSIISRQQRREHLARFDLPESFQPAPFDVIETHYASFDSNQLGSLDVFGPGSLAFQNRKKLIEKKKGKKAQAAEMLLSPTQGGIVLVEETPTKAPKEKGRAVEFSSPILEDDIVAKVDLIKDFDISDSEEIYDMDEEEE
jgi:hypothetical protein